jgi:Leucine-rich repeat (LRR) protein
VSDNWYLNYLDFSYNNVDLISLVNNTNLEYLSVSSNPLTTLNLISQSNLKMMHLVNNDLLPLIYFDSSRKLEYVSCHDNDILSTIKVKGADALKYLNCSNNDLNELDVSENLLLENLYCQNNRLSRLDLSLNTKLAFLKCNDNALEYLNIKNGQNILMTGGDTEYEGEITYVEGMNATNNPLLQCIDVDAEADAIAGFAPYDSWLKDPNAIYSEDCSSFLGVDDHDLASGINLFPNPSSEYLSISSEQQNIVQVTFYSMLGHKVWEINSGFENIDTKTLSPGIFLIRIRLDKGFVFKRYLKN